VLDVAVRCDDDRARGAVQRPRGHVAGQHPAHAAVVRRADHDEAGSMADRGVLQGAAG